MRLLKKSWRDILYLSLLFSLTKAMADSISYSFSYSYQAPTPSKPAAPELIAFDHCDEYFLPDGQVMVSGKISGKQSLLTVDLLHALKQCTTFLPITEHSAQLEQAIPGLAGQGQEIRRVFDQVRQTGLILTGQQIVDRFSCATPSLGQSATLVAILTCDRPKAVARLLESMRDRKFGEDYQIVLIDDSRHESNRLENLKVLECYAEQGGLRVRYFGAEQQTQLIRDLCAELPEHQPSIAFLLSPMPELATYGRSRNFALLLSVGKKLVMMDDDILYQPKQPPSNSRQIRFGPAPKQARFFSSTEGWDQWEEPKGALGHLQGMETALGSTVAQIHQLAAGQGLSADSFRQARTGYLSDLEASSRVILCSVGSLGDGGTSGSNWILQLDADNRTDLMQSEALYHSATSSKCHWLGFDHYALSNEFSLLSQMLGLDHRRLTAPYFPYFRNEDFLFGEILKALYPKDLCVNLPWAIPHLPLEARPWNKERLTSPPRYGLSDFAGDFLFYARQNMFAAEPADRLRAVAAALHDLGQASMPAIAARIIHETRAAIAADMTRLRTILTEGNLPAYFQADIEKSLSNHRLALEQKDPDFFPICLGHVPSNVRLDTAKGLWQRFATSLIAWPEIRAAAQRLAP